MESDSNPAVTQFVSELQKDLDHTDSRDLEPSNASESKHFHDENSSPDVMEHSSACPTQMSESSPTVLDNSIIKHENQDVSAAGVNDIPHLNKQDKIQPALSEETKSTKVNQPALPDETGSKEANQPALPGETGSKEANQPALPGETGSKEANQPALPGETGSKEANQPALPGETGSKEANQPARPDFEPYSFIEDFKKHMERFHAGEFSDYLFECKDNYDYYADLKKRGKLDRYKRKFLLEREKFAVESSNSEETSSSLQPESKQENVVTRPNECRNVIEVINGYVVINPTKYHSYLEKSPLSPPKNSSEECIQIFTPDSKYESSCFFNKITLKSFFYMLKDLVGKNLKLYSGGYIQFQVLDITDHSKKELDRVIRFLSEMNGRMGVLMQAVTELSDSFLTTEPTLGTSTYAKQVKDPGYKLQRKIQKMWFKAKEDNEKIYAVCRSNGNRNPNFDQKELVGSVCKIFGESFEYLSENCVMLETDIQNLCDKIKFFVTKIENIINGN